jgi:hypothetical protein
MESAECIYVILITAVFVLLNDTMMMNGRMDDIRVYAKEMNASEVMYLYNLPAD